MILCDRQIEEAIRTKQISVTPAPDPAQFDSSSLNLRVGDDFRIWKKSLRAPGTSHRVDLESIKLTDLIEFTDPLVPHDGVVVIEPEALVLVRTLEHIELPLTSKLAARVEGRSKQARLGLTAHLTAPTIHAGFAGRVTLEIKNFGPFHLEVVPNETRLCQLIFETVADVPRRSGSRAFSQQSTPLGTPPKPKRR